MPQTDQFVLGISFFVISGHREGWRLAGHDNDRETLGYYRTLAAQAEAAGLHFMFLGDSLDGAARLGRGWTPSLEPQVLAAALSAETETLGYIPSTSSLYQDPFTLARSLATLDHLSEGRAGWNILTSFYKDTARDNYTTGRKFAYEDRYAISQEFLDVVNKLWFAWEPGAAIRDRAGGWYVDTGKLTHIDHEGRYFRVKGALNVTRSPQSRPVFFVPVVSPDGQAFAARNAEVVFTRQPTLEDAQRFYRDVKQEAVAAGRDPSDLLVTPGIIVVVGETDEAAQMELDRLRPLIDQDESVAALEKELGYERDSVALDTAAAVLPGPASDTARTRSLLGLARDEGLDFADLAFRAAASRGFPLFVGSAATVADRFEQWFRGEGADGFVIGPIVAPDGFAPIHEALVPELRRRGLLRPPARKGQTLRDALGLPPARSQAWPAAI